MGINHTPAPTGNNPKRTGNAQPVQPLAKRPAWKMSRAKSVATAGGMGETALKRMKTNCRQYAAEQGLAGEAALKQGMAEKSK